jgi:hypothetical protein
MANRSLEAKLLKSKRAGKHERFAIDGYDVLAVPTKFGSKKFIYQEPAFVEKKAPDYLPCEVTARVVASGKTMRQVLRSHF